jgi:hypothetical protein
MPATSAGMTNANLQRALAADPAGRRPYDKVRAAIGVSAAPSATVSPCAPVRK